MNKLIGFVLLLFLTVSLNGQNSTLKIALLKYNGGGDWYANPTSLPNLVKFCNKNLGTNISSDIPTVEVGSKELFNYPFVHMTGHGNVVFNNEEIKNLRTYLTAGGFLHIDDNYGMDEFIRPEILKVFPEEEWVELPPSHPVFRQKYKFENGLPKIHEHDGESAQAFAIIKEGRILVLYTYECDLGDGWEDPEVHNDPVEKHEEALKMGANIIQFCFNFALDS